MKGVAWGGLGGRGSLWDQMLHVPLPHRVFGNSWDSDEDTPTRPQPQGHVPNVADANGYCSHHEDSTDGETEAQRGTTTHPGRPAGPLSLVGKALGLGGGHQQERT